LIHGRAPWARFLHWPFASAVFALVAGVLYSAIRPHLPPIANAALFLALPIAGYLLGRFAARRTPATVHQCGTRIEDGRCAQHAAQKRIQKDPTCITLAGIAVEPMDKTKHFKLIGTTGSGKSTAIRDVLRTALSRGDRALIADPDGGYLHRFYDPDRGDQILNPFDPRSARWDLFGELRDPYDTDQLARALIPDAADASGREWRAYARTFLAAILRSWRPPAYSCHPAGLA
jgi:hypothetical protein